MSPLHAPGATIAHPVFVNTACKEEAAIKVLMFPRRIRGDAGMMGVQLAWYLDGLDAGIPSFPAAVGSAERASFTRLCQRRKTLNRSLCLFTFHGFSFLLFTLCTSLCPRLKSMTSLGKRDWWCSGQQQDHLPKMNDRSLISEYALKWLYDWMSVSIQVTNPSDGCRSYNRSHTSDCNPGNRCSSCLVFNIAFVLCSNFNLNHDVSTTVTHR